MRHQDWPERLARYVKRRDIPAEEWIAGWLAECGGTQGEEIGWKFAQRGDVVQLVDRTAICVGRYCMPADGVLVPMIEIERAWRVG